MIYFVQSAAGGPIKIGATKCFPNRLVGLRTESGLSDLRVLAVMEGDFKGERKLHRQFLNVRVKGEWFDPDPALLAFIAENGRPWCPEDEPRFSVVQIDSEILPLGKAAALLEGKSFQEWVSDLVNEAAAKSLKRAPVKRKKPKPRA